MKAITLLCWIGFAMVVTGIGLMFGAAYDDLPAGEMIVGTVLLVVGTALVLLWLIVNMPN